MSLVHRSSNYCHILLRNRTSKRSANWQCVVGAAFRQPLPYLVTQWAPRKRSTKWQFVVGASFLQRVPYLVTLVHPSSNDCHTWLRCRSSKTAVCRWCSNGRKFVAILSTQIRPIPAVPPPPPPPHTHTHSVTTAHNA